ncbi:MAG TPA: hypothetical protein VMG12_33625, partial [Polyangiaceae bacterium]|nr:hypothetical protein [Polyangiaceae bacterium]
VGLCASLARGVRADVPAPAPEELGKVQAALERGAFSEAIAQLELWSDQGMVHPDLSFDRGVAYLGRAESPAQRRADLGQAVAAFEEAVHLDPNDEEAAHVVERIRTEITEHRDKRSSEGVVARPRLSRALLDLIGENVWAGLGALGALALSLGLATRLGLRGHRARLAGGIAAVVGLALGALGAGMAYVGHRLRVNTSPAVVIVEQARLHDGEGRPLAVARGASTLGEAADRVPEGTLVHISGVRGALVQIEWGDGDAWLEAREVRRLAVAPAGVGSPGVAAAD